MVEDATEELDTNPVPISRGSRRTRRVRLVPPPDQPLEPADGEGVESRAERIERLRKLIQEGNYHPDPYEVARAMMERGGLT